MTNEKSRTKQTSKNIIFGFLYKFVMLILSFISRKYFIRYIGIELLGINSLFSNILSILSLADLGIGIAMTYSLYEPLNNNDEKKICSLINFYKNVYNSIFFFILFFGIALIPFLNYIVNLEKEIDGLYFYYVLFLLQTCSSYVYVYKTTLLIADQKNYIVNFIATIANIIKVIVQIFIIVFLKNYYVYIITSIIGTLGSNAVINYYINMTYPFLNQKYRLEKFDKKKIFKNLGSVFLYKLSGVLINSTDNIIISFIVGTTALGYYSNYYTIVNQLSPFLVIIFNSLTASIGNLLVSSSEKKKYEVFKISTVISNYLGIILSVGFLILVQDFVELWLGKEYLLNNSLIIAMSLNLLYSCLNQPIWTYREASGLYIKTKYIMLLTAILNVLLSIILGLYYGIAGIIIATVISKMLICFWYEAKILFKDFFNQNSISFLKMFFKQLIIYALCCLITYSILNLIECYSWIMWIVKAIILIIIVTVVFACFNLRNNEMLLFFKYLKKLKSGGKEK